MTEAALNEQISAPSATDLSPGAALAAVRDEHGLSIDQVADALRYSTRQLTALEADDYAALPGPVVVRGMVRAYAKHLGVDAEPLIDSLRARLADTPPALSLHKMAVPFPGSPSRGHRFYVIGSIVLVLVAAALLTNWSAGVQELVKGWTRAPGAGGTQTSQEVVGSSVDEQRVAPAAADAVPTLDTTASASTASSKGGAAGATNPSGVLGAASAPGTPGTPIVLSPAKEVTVVAAVAPVQTPAAPVSAGHKRIELTFDGESWVQIRSGSGEMLMNDLNAPATQRVVTGQPPFQIVIGAAAGVRMRYQNAPFDLVPHIKDDVARIALD